MTDPFAPPPERPAPPPVTAPHGAPPPPPPYAAGPAAATNGLAIAALVTGLFGVFPVAIGLGIAALVQTRRNGQRGRGMAIAGIALGSVVGAGFVALVALGAWAAFDTEPLGDLSATPSREVGTCLDEGARWSVTDCSGTHDAEVYFVGDYDPEPYPGQDALWSWADEQCLDEFKDYTGESYYTSDDEYAYFLPSRAEWERGDRALVCVLTGSFFGDLVGSHRG